MNHLFQFKTKTLTTHIDKNQVPWFNANEICEILGFKNARDAIANHVHEDDVAKRDTIDSMGRTQVSNFVNESGLYTLIFGSTKKEAKVFKRWVTSEVLPSIRKFGSYAMTPAAHQWLEINVQDVKAVAEDLAHVYKMREANYMNWVEQEKTTQLRLAQKHDQRMLDLEARVGALEVKVDVLTKGGEQNEREWAKIKAEGLGGMNFDYLH
jgi:prophage antirepressor-like protein